MTSLVGTMQCAESFNKVHKALNKVHNVKRTDWDLRVPKVLWAYRTACKNLIAQAPPRLKYEAITVSPIVLGEIRPCMIALIDTKVRGTLEAEIRQGNLRLQEIEEERIRLRKKSTLMDAEVKKLEDEIKEYFLGKKLG